MRSERQRRGFSLQELMVVLGIVLVLVAISIPVYVQSRVRANELAAVATLRSLHQAQESFRRTHDEFGLLPELVDEGLVDPSIDRKARETNGYELFVRTSQKLTGRNRRDMWGVIAWPVSWGVSGERMFLMLPDGVIYQTSQQLVSSRKEARAFTRKKAFRFGEVPPEFTPIQ